MKVLLINPGTEMRHKQFNREPPQGLLYIAANLEKKGHAVQILDLPRQKLKLENPDLIGITCLTNTFNRAISILKEIKEQLPGVKTVIGGPHASFMPEESLGTGVVDYVIKGEGEESLLNLGEEKIIQTKPIDLNKLPLPARHLLKRKYDVAGVVVNRGCPFKCIYCVRQKLFSVCRLRDPVSLQQELKQIKQLDYQYFNLYDNLNISSEHAVEVCKSIHQSGVNLPWGCELRADHLTYNLAQLLAKTGCRAIGVGVESGSEKVLKIINKNQNPKLVKKGIENAKKAGLIVQAYFVLGLPGETWETFKQTLQYLQSLPLDPEQDKIDFFIATPYPGSDLWEKQQELGIKILTKNWDLYDTEHVVMETQNLKKRDIEQMRQQARKLIL
jgi:radical SAM superfamily enzyme YgiQ (UPF0313 family)